MIRRNFEQIFKFSERLWFTKKRHLKKKYYVTANFKFRRKKRSEMSHK